MIAVGLQEVLDGTWLERPLRDKSREALIAKVGREKEPLTYKTTNLRGFTMNMPVGTSAKPIMNIAAAARLRPPNRSRRSHRLTMRRRSCQLKSTPTNPYLGRIRKSARLLGWCKNEGCRNWCFCHRHPTIWVAQLMSQPKHLTHPPLRGMPKNAQD